jgi:hypothetical protein
MERVPFSPPMHVAHECSEGTRKNRTHVPVRIGASIARTAGRPRFSLHTRTCPFNASSDASPATAEKDDEASKRAKAVESFMVSALKKDNCTTLKKVAIARITPKSFAYSNSHRFSSHSYVGVQ